MLIAALTTIPLSMDNDLGWLSRRSRDLCQSMYSSPGDQLPLGSLAATKLPQPGVVTIRPSSFSAARTFRAVDTAHLLVTGALSRRSLYVGLTRGRESNTAHIVTGNTAPPGHPPYAQASPESVVKAIMDRDDADLSATEQIRHAQDWTEGTGHLLALWSAAVRRSLYPQIDERIKARLTGSEAWRYDREHSRPVLQERLRAAQLAGHDIGAVIDQIAAAPVDGARSISSVLHGRLQQLDLPNLGYNVTWAQRTPANAPAAAYELAVGLDDQARALGERLAASPEP